MIFDELFEMLALEQTHKIPRIPIILVGSDFWRPLDELIKNVLKDRYQTISEDDLKLYEIMDNYDDIIRKINQYERKQED